MHTLASLREGLTLAPKIALQALLVRIVPLGALLKNQPPDWLFTSGKPNRYNPAGVECLYFAEDNATARAEYDSYWTGMRGQNQPLVMYYAEIRLRQVLDLANAATVKGMGLREAELFAPWRRSKQPTATQLLGQIVSEDSVVSAIRYPSKAARQAGFMGANMVIFRDCIRRPDSVRILGPTKRALQRWP